MTFKHFYFFAFMLMGIITSLAQTQAPVTIGTLTLSGNRCIRPSSGVNTAAYITIANSGPEKDKLIKAECADTTVTELHNHSHDNGVMRMRPVDFIEIGNEPVALKPGSLHIMLMGLKESFRGKKSIPLTLTFEKAGPVTLDFPVKVPE